MREPGPVRGARRPVHVVLPTLNRCDKLADVLDALARQSVPPVSVVVIDSGSGDGTPAMVREHPAGATLLEVPPTIWWSGAVAAGVRHLQATLDGGCRSSADVVLLNDDLSFDDDLLERLSDTAAASAPDTLVGAVVLDRDAEYTITHGGCRIGWWSASWRELNRGRDLRDFAPGHLERPDTLSGRGVLVPMAAFDRVGPPDEQRLPQHGDNEFAIRAHRVGFGLLTGYDARIRCDFARGTDLNHRPLSGVDDLKTVLTSRRSYVNVRERLAFAWLTRRNPLQLLAFIAFDWARVGVSLWRRFRDGRSVHAD